MMVMGENLFAFFGIAKFGQSLIRGAPHLPLQRNMQCGSYIALSKDIGAPPYEKDLFYFIIIISNR